MHAVTVCLIRRFVSKIVEDFGTDVFVNAGTGIFAHPSGPTEGARAFTKAIDAALEVRA